MKRRALLASIATLSVASCGNQQAPVRRIGNSGRVLALGDSLTYGTGARSEESYPAQLSLLTGWNVVKDGRAGITARAFEPQVKEAIERARPDLTLVSLGLNDFRQRLPDRGTLAALRAICSELLDAKTQVVLCAMPQVPRSGRFGHRLADSPLYRTLARQLPIHLCPDLWSRTLERSEHRHDGIHPNASGYRAFAQGFAVWLEQGGFL